MSKLPLVLALALVSTVPAGIAAARPAAESAVKLSLRGVDFADRQQVKAFYEHVRVAARAACNSDSLTPGAAREDRECRVQFVNDAVNQVNAPLLTAMNNAADTRQPTRAYAFGDQ